MSAENATSEVQWWVAVRDKSTGPYSTGYLAASLRSGLISVDQLVCPVNGSEWRPAREWRVLESYLPQKTSQSKQPTTAAPEAADDASALGRLLPPTRVVQAIAIYGIAVSPGLWFLSLLTGCSSGMTYADGSDAQSWEALLFLSSPLVTLLLVVGWFVAGFLLNRFDQRGLSWAIGVYASTWLVGGVYAVLYLTLGIVFLNAEQRVAQPAEVIVSLFGTVVGLFDFAFQTIATIVLYSARRSIPWNTAG